MFWPERLARLVNTISANYPQYWSHPELQWLKNISTHFNFSDAPPNGDEISVLIASAKKYSDQEMHTRLSQIERILQIDFGYPSPSLLNWQQVKEMTNTGLVEIGSHTCRHIRLNKHTPAKLVENEIANSKKEIEKHISEKVKTFCFPNGDYSPLSLELAKQNYIGAVTTQSGWNDTKTDNHLLRRIGIHQDIAKDNIAFLARISGWM